MQNKYSWNTTVAIRPWTMVPRYRMRALASIDIFPSSSDGVVRVMYRWNLSYKLPPHMKLLLMGLSRKKHQFVEKRSALYGARAIQFSRKEIDQGSMKKAKQRCKDSRMAVGGGKKHRILKYTVENLPTFAYW